MRRSARASIPSRRRNSRCVRTPAEAPAALAARSRPRKSTWTVTPRQPGQGPLAGPVDAPRLDRRWTPPSGTENPNRMTSDLLILGWHNVEGTWCFPSGPGQGTRGLEAQLRWVRRLGHVVDLGEALDGLHTRWLPAAMLAFDVALRLSRDAPAQRWRTLLPGYLAVAVPLVFYLAVRAQVLSHTLAVTDFLDNPLVGAGFRTSRLTAIAILGKYLGLLVWPARLSADYSYHQIPLFSWSLGSWTFWSAALSA